MAVAPISSGTPQIRHTDYVPPSALYDEIKSVAVPAGAWLYENVYKPLRNEVKPAANFWGELGASTLKSNFIGSLEYDGVGSLLRNGLALAKHQEKPDRAVGNVLADVSVGTAKGIVSGLTVTAMTMGATAVGLCWAPALLTTIPMLAITIGSSWLTYKGLDSLDKRYGVHQQISNAVTKLIDQLGGMSPSKSTTPA